jgi:hypothetical protein
MIMYFCCEFGRTSLTKMYSVFDFFLVALQLEEPFQDYVCLNLEFVIEVSFDSFFKLFRRAVNLEVALQ